MLTEVTKETLKRFMNLFQKKREKFIEFVTARSQVANLKAVAKAKFADDYVCLHCHAKGKGVTRCGKTARGRQRYKCQHCGRGVPSQPRQAA